MTDTDTTDRTPFETIHVLEDDAYAQGFNHGYDLATAHAVSRRRLGLPIERGDDAVD